MSIDLAKRWMNDHIKRLFYAEIANEANGGTSPSTLSSTIDSISQAPDIMCEGWTAEDFVALLLICDLVGTGTELGDLLLPASPRSSRS